MAERCDDRQMDRWRRPRHVGYSEPAPGRFRLRELYREDGELELARQHLTWLAGREVGHVPFRIDGALARYVVLPLLFRVIAQRVLTVDTRIGRKMRPTILSRGSPLVRVRPKDLTAAGSSAFPGSPGFAMDPRDGGSRGPFWRHQRGVVHVIPTRLLLDRAARVRRAGTEALSGVPGSTGATIIGPRRR